MKSVAIIPARGGSKRIPHKNIRKFHGKPVIAYSIEVAVKSGLFDLVMVSTDDIEIANVAKRYGAEIPFFRSSETSDDFATTAEVLIEVIRNLQESGQMFDLGCCIYPTAPLVQIKHLKRSYDLLINKEYTTVMPVVRFGYPIFRSLKRDLSGRVEMFWPEYRDTRSQDLSDAFHDAGQFYWFRTEVFLKNPVLFGENSGSVVLTGEEVQDIDTEEDWRAAERKAEQLWKKK